MKSQIVISSWGGSRRAPRYAFTELGVAMLSSVVKSKRAVQMNILVMRAFVRMREMLATNKDLAHRIRRVETQQLKHTSILTEVVLEIKTLQEPAPLPPKRRIGFTSRDVDRSELL